MVYREREGRNEGGCGEGRGGERGRDRGSGESAKRGRMTENDEKGGEEARKEREW